CLSLSTARVLLRFLSDDTAATEIYTLSLHDALPICEKNSDKEFDFDNDPIEPMIVDGWVKANGTTLGADCGIGIAAQLAVLTSRSEEHTSELQSRENLVCRLLLEKKKNYTAESEIPS